MPFLVHQHERKRAHKIMISIYLYRIINQLSSFRFQFSRNFLTTRQYKFIILLLSFTGRYIPLQLFQKATPPTQRNVKTACIGKRSKIPVSTYSDVQKLRFVYTLHTYTHAQARTYGSSVRSRSTFYKAARSRYARRVSR